MKFLSTGREYDMVAKKILNDVSKIKNSNNFSNLLKTYQKNFSEIQKIRDSSNSDKDYDRYEQAAKAYDNFIPNLEKARDVLERQEELKSALKI